MFIVLECDVLDTPKKNSQDDSLDRHWMLQYTVLKGDLFFRHHDVSVIRLAPLLKTHQFVSVTAVRKNLGVFV